jgi:hypothetical protein
MSDSDLVAPLSLHFSDYYGVPVGVVDSYGAFDISLGDCGAIRPRFAISSQVEKNWGMQGSSRPDRQLLDAAVSQLLFTSLGPLHQSTVMP